jgi:hypothetical protein
MSIEQRLEAVEHYVKKLLIAVPSAGDIIGQPAPKPERWIPKPGTKTLCWCNDIDSGVIDFPAIVVSFNNGVYRTLSGSGWHYAIPLTPEEVAEMTWRPEPAVEKTCANCVGGREYCRACQVDYIGSDYIPSNWHPKDSKPVTRYDWSKAPAWVKFWTTDKSGHQDWWKVKPTGGESTKIWYAELPEIWGNVNICQDNSGSDCPDWADSLEERPEGV